MGADWLDAQTAWPHEVNGRRTMALTIYGQPDCAPCKAVTRKLDKENVTYDYVDVTKNPTALRRMRESGITATPAAETPTDVFPATDVKRLNAAIDESRTTEPRPESPKVSADIGPSR